MSIGSRGKIVNGLMGCESNIQVNLTDRCTLMEQSLEDRGDGEDTKKVVGVLATTTVQEVCSCIDYSTSSQHAIAHIIHCIAAYLGGL